MKKKRGLLLVLALLIVTATAGAVTLTYSRYSSSASGSDTAQVATWKVQVNGTDIVAQNTFTANSINWTTNANIAEGYIAPSSTGTFDIVINPTGSKVAMKYELSIDTEAFQDYPQIAISSVKVGSTPISADGSGKYTGVIPLSEVEAGTEKTLTVTIEWTNSESNNTSDTTIGSTIQEFEIPVTVTVTQDVA